MNYLPSPPMKGVFCNFLVASCNFFWYMHCMAFSDDFPQHGKAWKSMGTSVCLQIGYIQRILIAYCQSVIKTTLKALNLILPAGNKCLEKFFSQHCHKSNLQ